MVIYALDRYLDEKSFIVEPTLEVLAIPTSTSQYPHDGFYQSIPNLRWAKINFVCCGKSVCYYAIEALFDSLCAIGSTVLVSRPRKEVTLTE